MIILALLGGVAALVFRRFMIIVSTSLGGAWNVVTGIAYFATDDSIDPTSLEILSNCSDITLCIILICWLALGIAGIFVQYKSTSPQKWKTRTSRATESQNVQING